MFLPGEFRGQRSLAGCSPRGQKESDTTERLTLSLAALAGAGPGFAGSSWAIAEGCAVPAAFCKRHVCGQDTEVPQPPPRLMARDFLVCNGVVLLIKRLTFSK